MKFAKNKYYWVYWLYTLLFIGSIVLYIYNQSNIIGWFLSLKTIFIIYYYFKDDKEKTSFLRDLFLIDLIICLIFFVILGGIALIKIL